MDTDNVFNMREMPVTSICGVRHAWILLIREEVFSPMKERHISSVRPFMRPGLGAVRMNGLLGDEGDVFDMERHQSSVEFFLGRLRKRLCKSQENFSGFSDRP